MFCFFRRDREHKTSKEEQSILEINTKAINLKSVYIQLDVNIKWL